MAKWCKWMLGATANQDFKGIARVELLLKDKGQDRCYLMLYTLVKGAGEGLILVECWL